MVALVTTLHDPEARMVEATNRQLAAIGQLYEAVVVVPTSGTSPRLLDALHGAKVESLSESNGAVGVGRRHSLKLGLETGATHLHYCDFDRVLHWMDRYPNELAGVLEAIQRYDYLMLGRTERAFASHPRVQRDTETITNHAFSLWFGREVDISAGSCGVSRRAAQLILDRSIEPTNATDAEWPALVKVARMSVECLETEGLEFETPDFSGPEIERAGSLEAWMEERSRPLSVWVARTRLTLDSIESALRVAGSR